MLGDFVILRNRAYMGNTCATNMHKILDLWSGTGSATQAFKDNGHEIISVDIRSKYNPTICGDIVDVTPEMLLRHNDGEMYEFGWASPECKVYSMANCKARHFTADTKPNTVEAVAQNMRVQWTRILLEKTCKTWVMENPRGLLRTQYFMKDLPRHTVTYCQYGDTRMKPTDLWGKFPRLWEPRPPCNYGDDCHVASPRGSKTGTIGLEPDDRARVPYDLGKSLYLAIRLDDGGNARATLKEWL